MVVINFISSKGVLKSVNATEGRPSWTAQKIMIFMK